MKVDCLVAEIGSTTTVVNAFTGLTAGIPRFVAQGAAATSVLDGDVNIGLMAALRDAERSLGEAIAYDEMFASSSAAGGLRMTVHGLVYDMTVKAAKEAALGSGAVMVDVTAGRLSPYDVERIRDLAPNMILLAGGVDYGEKQTALANFMALLPLLSAIPLVYAGNIENQRTLDRLAVEHGVEVRFADNVYPSIDTLHVEPTRRLIQELFEKHIVHAPGMARIRDLVNGPIMPTPGAVMAAAELARELFGDVVVFDVGGATTDVHSVTEGDAEIARLATSPEPFAKRTVEGDLGVYVNRLHVYREYEAAFADIPAARQRIAALTPLPQTAEERKLVSRLTKVCMEMALQRHAGRLVERYTPSGRLITAVGRDLTAVRTIIGTGGPLTRLAASDTLWQGLRKRSGDVQLYPPEDARILIDHDYIMASLGVLAARYPEAAKTLLLASVTREQREV